MSTFNGEIVELPGVCVDNFENVDFKCFFISHCHTDHLKGIENFSHNSEMSIYCTNISAHFIRRRYPKLDNQLKVVEIGSETLIDIDDLRFQVTFIPSGHCAGSCMILFQTEDQNILYTGDFRVSLSEIENIKALHGLKNLSVYIDSTFMKKMYMNFPTQTESVRVISNEIANFLNSSESHKVHLIVPARIGYEHLIMKIHENLKLKVYVEDHDHYQISAISELRSCLSSDEKSSKICLKLKPRNNQPVKPTDRSIMIIKLSAMIWMNWEIGKKFVKYENDRVMRICYATHSSYAEIRDFITFLKPTKINLNVMPENGLEKLRIIRDLEEIQKSYEEIKTDIKPKRFMFKRAMKNC